MFLQYKYIDIVIDIIMKTFNLSIFSYYDEIDIRLIQ